MTNHDLKSAVASFLHEGGTITVVTSAKAKGVKPAKMKLTNNRSAVMRNAFRSTFALGYSAMNYERFQECRQACALGKVSVE